MNEKHLLFLHHKPQYFAWEKRRHSPGSKKDFLHHRNFYEYNSVQIDASFLPHLLLHKHIFLLRELSQSHGFHFLKRGHQNFL